MPAANRSGVAHLPRKKIPPNLRSLARGHTAPCVKVLAGVVGQEAVSPAARVSAAGILGGWGRPPQPNTGEDDKDIHVTIRNIVEPAAHHPFRRIASPTTGEVLVVPLQPFRSSGCSPARARRWGQARAPGRPRGRPLVPVR